MTFGLKVFVLKLSNKVFNISKWFVINCMIGLHLLQYKVPLTGASPHPPGPIKSGTQFKISSNKNTKNPYELH